MNGTALVTGASGFIGSAVVRRLLGEGWRVRCLLRPSSDASRLAGLEHEVRRGDVLDAASLREAAEGTDALLHLAGPSSWSEIAGPGVAAAIEAGARNALAAAGGRRVVFVSSMVAFGGTRGPAVLDETAPPAAAGERLGYARGKQLAEAACRDAAAAGRPVVVVNPGEVYGEDDRELVTAGNLVDFARSSPVVVPRGGTLVAHRDDVALAIVRALERGRPGERYILGGENLALRDLAALVLELLGRRARVIELPGWLVSGVATTGRALGLPLPFDANVIPYAVRWWFGDASRARRELGVEFRGAREALEPTLAWLRATGRIPAGSR